MTTETDTAPLFGLSASQIKNRIKAAAKAVSLEGVSSHGCRIGMALDLARAKGIEMSAIMQAGGWRSETTVAKYTARKAATRGAVARFNEQQAPANDALRRAVTAARLATGQIPDPASASLAPMGIRARLPPAPGTVLTDKTPYP